MIIIIIIIIMTNANNNNKMVIIIMIMILILIIIIIIIMIIIIIVTIIMMSASNHGNRACSASTWRGARKGLRLLLALHPVSITRFLLRRFSPGAGLLRNRFVHR